MQIKAFLAHNPILHFTLITYYTTNC